MSINNEKVISKVLKQCFVQFVQLLTDNFYKTFDFHQNTNVLILPNRGLGLLLLSAFNERLVHSQVPGVEKQT